MTTVSFYRTYEGEPEEIGAVSGDGEVISGDGDKLARMGAVEAVVEQEPDDVLRMFNGPSVTAFIEDENEGAETKQWIPYTGPQGGDGWRNLESDDIIYQDEPPGGVLTPEEFVEAAEDAGIDPEAIEEIADELEAIGDEPVEDYRSIDSTNELMWGDDVTVEYNGREVSGTINDPGGPSDRAWIEFDEPVGGQTGATVEAGDVLSVERFENLDSEAEVSASKAFASASTHNLDEQTSQKVHDRVVEDAANAKRSETSDRMFGHVGAWKPAENRSGSLSSGRASHRGVASSRADRDASSTIRVSEDEDPLTISHETAHALADSYGYDTQRGTGISHRYPSDGLPDWDFGEDGEHGRKRDFMLTSYGDWDERGDFDWEDFEDRGEPVDLEADTEVGDRVAVVVDGETVEGTIAPVTQPVNDVDQLEVGETVTTSAGEDVSDELFGGLNDGFEDGEVEAVLHRGDYLVIGEDQTYPLPDGADPVEYETRPDVIEVLDITANQALISDGDEYQLSMPGDVEEAEGASDRVVRTTDGDDIPADRADEALLMAGKEDRDWTDVRHRLATDTVKGETVRFEFGAQDTPTEGIVVEETDAQITIGFHEGGEYQEKTINRTNAYNQQIWYAQDETEFASGTLYPDQNPPGFRQAKYDQVDITEAEVNWDTSIQYDDPADRIDQVEIGDVVLARDEEGDRHVFKVGDMLEPFGADEDQEAVEVQGNFGPESPYDISTDAPQRRMQFGEDTEWDIIGHSPREDWAEPDRTGEPTDNWSPVNMWQPPYNVEDGDKVRMTDPETDNTVEAEIVDYTQFEGYYGLYTDEGKRFFFAPDEDNTGDMPAGVVVRGGDSDETYGSPGRVIDSVKSGEKIDGGFKPRDASDVEPGMVVEVRSEDGMDSSVEEVVDVSGGTVETTEGAYDFDGPGPAVTGAAERRGAGDDERGHEEAAENLFAEVNRAWHKMVTEHEKRGSPRRRYQIGGGYSETNAHETLTKTHEAFQNPSNGTHARNVMDYHPDLAEAYLDVFDPADPVKKELNDYYEDRPYATPWDDAPFPEVNVDVEPGDTLTYPTGDEVEVLEVDGDEAVVEMPGDMSPKPFTAEEIEQWN